jgi:DNA (cytosine-5)-methyltransferase 1
VTSEREDLLPPANCPLAIDLFCGSGAVSAALKANGFKVVAAVDNNPTCARTYKLNHPEVAFRQRDIRKLRPGEIAKKIPPGRRLDLMVVCAPCQPFSSQNRRRGSVDPRAPLILQSIRFAKALRPQIIMFENVPGLATSDIFKELRRSLGAAGYQLGAPERIDAADFGVPQRRVRCIVAASFGSGMLPELVKTAPRKAGMTVRMAFSGLSPLEAGAKDSTDSLHVSRLHHEMTLKRLRHIPKNGGSRESLPDDLQLTCHKNCGPRKFSDVFGRMRWDDVAPTLTTGCTDVTRGRYAHPAEDRAITLREAARLQTFPDDYKFAGSRSEVADQIGNAVPFELARRLIMGLTQVKPIESTLIDYVPSHD